jgi:hypothetical protein
MEGHNDPSTNEVAKMNPDNFNAVDTAAGQAMIAKIQTVRAELLDLMGGPDDSSPEAYARWSAANQSVWSMTLDQLEVALALVKLLVSIKDDLLAIAKAERVSNVVAKVANVHALAVAVVTDSIAYAMLSEGERAKFKAIAETPCNKEGMLFVAKTWHGMALSDAQINLLRFSVGMI